MGSRRRWVAPATEETGSGVAALADVRLRCRPRARARGQSHRDPRAVVADRHRPGRGGRVTEGCGGGDGAARRISEGAARYVRRRGRVPEPPMTVTIQVIWWIGLVGALGATLVILKEVTLVLRALRDIH